MKLKQFVTDSRGRSAAVTGLIIAAMALIGANRHPWAFAALGAGWLFVTLAAWRDVAAQMPMPNLDAVVAAQERLTALEREIIAIRAERDRLIVAAFDDGASQYEIAKRLNLTRQAVQVAAIRGRK